MKKKTFYSAFALLMIAAGIAGWLLFKPPPPGPEKDSRVSVRKYTHQDRKQILTAKIEKDAGLWRERYILGGLYLQDGDFRRAMEQFKIIIKIRPKMVLAYNALGMCYLNLGKNDEAAATWRKTLEIDPENKSARDLIARIEGVEKRTRERRKFEISLKKNPDQPQMWFDLGEIYLKEKLYDRAIFALKKATELEPGRPDYLYRLGYTYHITRDYHKAEPVLKAAQAQDPENEEIRRILEDTQAKKRASKGP